jgi:MFS transporter, SP family, galactose:H+ symporter
MQTRDSTQQRRFTIVIATTIAIGGLLFGYDTAVISGAILFVRNQFHLTSIQTELAVSIVLAGALFGASCGGYLGDRFGRRPVLAATALIYAVFGFATGASHSLSAFLVARLFIGFAVGLSSMLTPLYIAELAPAKTRGALVTLNQIAITSGAVVAYYVDYLFAPSGNWRWMFMSAIIPSAILLAGLFFLPETPRWLSAQGRFDEAFRVLARIEDIAEAERDIAELRRLVEIDQLKFSDLVASRFAKPLAIGVGLAVFQQITGVNTVVYYAPTIFRSAGFPSESSAIWATFIMGLVALATTVASMFLIDRFGRRPLLLGSILAMGVTLLHLGYIIGLTHPSRVLIVGDVVAYVGAFDLGLGPVFWLLISEIYPTTIRGQAMSLASAVIWISDFLVTVTFLTLLDHLGTRGSFFLYAGICAVAFIFSFRTVPETRGKSLEEIERSWQRS